MSNQSYVISKAPGKILLAGGYGVLEQYNYGLTFAVNSHFYCICRTNDQSTNKTDIKVVSRQINSQWHYIETNGILVQSQSRQNKFVQNAIFWTLKYFNRQKNAGHLSLQIIFDRNFVSDAYAVDQSPFPQYKEGYSKTGLGSSACVVVSIVKCLTLVLNSQLKKDEVKFIRLANVISQIANLNAQKKIGSNFDISTAVFGTHLYKNILPHKIGQNLQSMSQEQIQKLVKINPEIQLINKPEAKLHSFIIDINKGADTRVMVKSFMSELKKCTQQIQAQFFKISKQIVLDLYQHFNKQQFQKIKQINCKHRLLQQKYSAITNVPIQPKQLTPLIDQICKIKQVIYAICPGSGGFDAVFVLALEDIFQQLVKITEGNTVRPVQISFTNSIQMQQQEKEKIFNRLQSYI